MISVINEKTISAHPMGNQSIFGSVQIANTDDSGATANALIRFRDSKCELRDYFNVKDNNLVSIGILEDVFEDETKISLYAGNSIDTLLPVKNAEGESISFTIKGKGVYSLDNALFSTYKYIQLKADKNAVSDGEIILNLRDIT